ncbi:MAG: glutamine synthetase beta-grasp domain-containing protein, partial [Succinivibrio sp.]|nr:glutamine synthetase beta-grasp domain-containing protein [Succinivibrio sp.]
MNIQDVAALIAEHNVKFADLRFTDTRGKEQHITLPAACIDEKFFDQGKLFDGSSIAGWKGIDKSDMLLMPDLETVKLDPFYADPTIFIRCDILDPETLTGYSRDPRSIARRS